MIYEKVLFVYTTLLQEGMAAAGFNIPNVVLFDVDPLKIYSLVVTCGFLTDTSKIYWNEIDVTFNDKSVIDPAFDGESTFNVLGSGYPNKDHYSSVSSFYLKGIRLTNPGLYTAKVSLYDSGADGKKGNLIDVKDSHFIVAGDFE
ncbi:hypothetical protein RVV74_001220 [Enterobacter ludwigii]|nr:hypothetical protein [Enterobacter ludwigii]